MTALLNTYYWELEFDDGSKMTRPEWLRTDKKLDPNDPGRPVKVVRLIPVDDTLSVLRVNVPEGSLPVAVRQSERPQVTGDINRVVWKIGFNLKGVRHMICVDATTKEVFQDIDNGGCRV